MRTYLNRLTFSAAGVVLTCVGTAAAAHAVEDGLSLEETPTHIQETVPVVPEVNKCEIEFTVEDCAMPVDERPKPVFTLDPELIRPGLLDDDSPDPGDDTPEDPEAGGPEKPEDPEDGGSENPGDGAGEPVDQPADDGHGGQSEPSGDGSGDVSPDTSDDAASEETADEPTPESDETTVTPVSQEIPADEGGNRNVLFGVLAIALGSLGLAVVGFGLGRRPHAVRKW